MPLTDSGLLNRGSLLVWGGFTLLLVLAPLVFNSGASVSFLSQLCTLMVFCLSYNMLLGQGGMLSFGHAVFSGLGAYFSIHTMNWAAAGGGLPLPFIPIAGGVNGLLFSFIGGVGSFAGPLVGSVAGGLLTVKLSDYTMAWQLYLGIFFVLFVMYAPAGLSGIMFANWRVIRAGLFPQMARIWLQVVAAALVILGGTVLVIELAYAYTFGTQKGLSGKVIAAMDGSTLMAVWLAGIVLVVIGCIWLRQRRQAFRSAWSAVNLRIDSRERGDAK